MQTLWTVQVNTGNFMSSKCGHSFLTKKEAKEFLDGWLTTEQKKHRNNNIDVPKIRKNVFA